MNIRTLRTVLLIQAIEESDRAGEVVPLQERADATRTAAPVVSTRRALAVGPNMSPDCESFLAGRAQALLARVRSRSPAVDHVLALANGSSWLGSAFVVLALALGLFMSALDGSRRIHILSLPLLILMAWNLVVYALLLAARLRGSLATRAPGFGSARLYGRWVSRRIDALLIQSRRFNVPLATGLRRFAGEWAAIVDPLFLGRATRLMHLAAALVAVGLVAGLYFRGFALHYTAGWEGAFPGARVMHAFLVILYGPAAAMSGLEIPAAAGLAALHWTGTSGGGGQAITWIHLIALTAALYVVVPRLVLACVAGFGLWRYSSRVVLPAPLLGYSRALLLACPDGAASEAVYVTCFAFEPGADSLAGLKALLAIALGGAPRIEVGPSVRYGQEEEGLRALPGGSPVCKVLLMTLASTPEPENHGRVIRGLRDSVATSGALLVLVDTGPFASRLHGDASFSGRLEERRKLWAQFVAAYGLRACLVDLTHLEHEPAQLSTAVEAARAVLWAAGEGGEQPLRKG